jgi:hypothetical protein
MITAEVVRSITMSPQYCPENKQTAARNAFEVCMKKIETKIRESAEKGLKETRVYMFSCLDSATYSDKVDLHLLNELAKKELRSQGFSVISRGSDGLWISWWKRSFMKSIRVALIYIYIYIKNNSFFMCACS